MAERDAFLRTIRERPDDDGPRLVYADWLEEQGDPRGEFIRIQCELAKLPPWDPRRPALEEREADLLAVHDYEWLGRPPKWVTDWEFKRGFVNRFTVTRPTLAGLKGLLGESIRPRAFINVDHHSKPRDEFHRSPYLELLGGLAWGDLGLGEDRIDVRQLISSPRLSSLDYLWLVGSGDELVESLRRRPGAQNLNEFGIESLSAAATEEFLQARELHGVHSLRFDYSAPPEFVHDLGQAPFRWRKLDLGQTPFSFSELAGLSDCQRLTELHLSWSADWDQPLPLPPSLRRLHLNRDSPTSLPPALPNLTVLPHLEWLHMRVEQPLRHESKLEAGLLGELLQLLRGPVLHLEAVNSRLTLGALAALPAKDRLRRLYIICEDSSNDDVRAFTACDGFAGLEALHLYCPRLTPRQVEMLAEMPFPRSLKRFSIHAPEADDQSLARLFRSSHFQRLTRIEFIGCPVGSRTLAALIESPGLQYLRELVFPWGAEIRASDWEHTLRCTPGVSPLLHVRMR